MTQSTRMSPLTAFFFGLFGFGAVAIGCVTAIAIHGLNTVDDKASAVLNLVDGTLEGLPDLIASLPPAVGDLLNDRRAPDYARNIDVQLRFVPAGEGVRPVLTVSNKGDQVVSMLALRVAALGTDSVPLSDWTEVVATPIALDDDWRGPLYPGSQRYVVLNRTRSLPAAAADSLAGAVEIADIRVWSPRTEM